MHRDRELGLDRVPRRNTNARRKGRDKLESGYTADALSDNFLPVETPKYYVLAT
jgi:hypothetical protein